MPSQWPLGPSASISSSSALPFQIGRTVTVPLSSMDSESWGERIHDATDVRVPGADVEVEVVGAVVQVGGGVVCARRGRAQPQSMKAVLRESASAKIVRMERAGEPCVTMMRGSVG